MTILVLSDSHGELDNMVGAVERTQPDRIFHLGDGWRDAEKLASKYPEIPMEQVPGNCDLGRPEKAEKLVKLEGLRLLLCHGHTQYVKSNLSILTRTAQERSADAALFGHTHRPFVDMRAGIALLNPGSIGPYGRPSYGILQLWEGKCLPSTFYL